MVAAVTIGVKLVVDVTTEDVRNVVWRKKNHGFDAAAGQICGVMKRLMDYAVTCGLAASNPVLALPMRHVHKAHARDRTLSPEEIRIFLNAVLSSNVRRQFKVALRLILMTMARKSELMLARWSDVHFEESEWHIPIEHSKAGKPHIVYLSRQAIVLFRELEVLASGSELVLPGRGSMTKPFALNGLNQEHK
jgi:integrase